MSDTAETNYRRIEASIDYIRQHFREQPSLDDMASAAGLSPFYFQRIFTEWAGVSPKTFMQYLSLEYAKQLIAEQQSSLLETALETGLSGTSRLHDLFIKIEGMTPGEFKNGGEQMTIHYQFAHSPFGQLIAASTAKGVCHLSFEADKTTALANLQSRFPNAQCFEKDDELQHSALSFFQQDWKQLDQVKLHLKGTPFQLKVWEALLKIPLGQLSTYGEIAKHIEQPTASRAVGTAIGSNPVAFLIPCHRVIQASGQIGGYHWGSNRKSAMIGWEAARVAGE